MTASKIAILSTRALVLGFFALFMALAPTGEAQAASTAEMNAEADATLKLLRETQPVSEEMIKKAKGILIFPKIVKGGLLVGAAAGEGVLRVNGKTQGYYNSVAVSYGLQAGLSWYGFVMFMMDDNALNYLQESSGWEVGVGPSVTVVDQGVATKLSTTTAQEGVYVFFVGQNGFFAGAGIEGTKISKITP